MKRIGTILISLVLVFLAFNAAQADLTYTFNSPQDDGSGNIPGAAPFVININHNAILPEDVNFTGGTFGVYLYSDDGSIAKVTHRDVDGIGPFESLAFSSDWTATAGATTFMNASFGEVDPGFNGTLPDTAFISFVGFGLIPLSGDHMSFALQVDNAIGGTQGRLCIDSAGGPYITDDGQWLFPEDHNPVTCEGKCWTITGLTPTDVHAIGDSDDLLPSEFGLGQNYPNPFNPSTTFEFALPQRSQVMIEVFNVLGQKVVTLAEGDYAAGLYQVTWDGTDHSGSPVASGIYFYKMQANKYTATKKLLLLK